MSVLCFLSVILQ